MWKLRLLTSTLAAALSVTALLLSSTAGLAAHAHLETIDPGVRECVAAHGAQGGDQPELRGARLHQHRCLGFHLPGLRALYAAAGHGALLALPQLVGKTVFADFFGSAKLAKSALPRGPPSV